MNDRFVRALVLSGCGLAVLWGCTDAVPTLSEAGELLPGDPPTTIQHLLSTDEVLLGTRVEAGDLGAEDAGYRLVANDFGGELTAHTLARFRAFPDTIDLIEQTDSQFRYLESEVIATVPDSLQTSAPLLDFELWTVTQPWDSLAVSWEFAVDVPGARVPWVTPGGTRGQRLGMARWELSATTDSLIWDIPGGVVEQLATGAIPGLMVTLVQPDSRAQISPLVVRAQIEPSVDRDTVITRTIGPGPHDFVFTPDPPRPDDVLRVGGITSDRSYVRLDLSNAIPICPVADPATCDQFASPEEVSLNVVELLLDPVPVESGFRPIAPFEFLVRRVLEPELGELAPLGPVIAVDTLTVAQAAGRSSEPVVVDLTAAVETLLRADETELALALLIPAEASSFSYGWFARNPRLRFVYTLPQRPELP